MHENCSSILYDTIAEMQNINIRTLDLNRLNDAEIDELSDIIFRYGFWGEKSHLSIERKKDYLTKNLRSRFQDILKNVYHDKKIVKILILSFVNEILELNLSTDDFNMIFVHDNIDRIIRKRREDLGDLIDYTSDTIKVKSSTISKSLISSTVIQKDDILESLIQTSKRLDSLYHGNRKYTNALKNLASASYLSFIFDYELDASFLISYYEKIKENSFNKKNLFFWQQYAISCVNLKEFARAEKYFQTSYSLAHRQGRDFSTFQIDNHYARYLLEYQIYSRNLEKSLDVFIRAHKLLLKRHTVDDAINDRYYQFRVAVLYKEYYDTFFDKYSDDDKKIFLDRCKEMNSNLQTYMKNNTEFEAKKYIYDCQRNLEYILG